MHHEFLHDQRNRLRLEAGESDNGVEAVAEFGREHALDRRQVVAFPHRLAEADRRFGEVDRTGIGRHDQNDVAEVDLLAIVVGQLAVIHDLQQHVEQIRMCLLDLVHQHHAVGMLIDAVGKQAPLIEPDIAGRRPDQPRHRVALHVFRHVETQQLDPHGQRQLPCHFGLADTGRAREKVAADGLFRLAEAGAGQFDRRRNPVDRRVLSVDHALDCHIEMFQHLRVVLRDRLRWNTGHGRHRTLDFLDPDRLATPRFRQQHLRSAGFVDHIDRLVGQFAIVDVAGRQLDGALDRIVGVANLVIFLEIRLQSPENFDRVGNRRLVDVDLLEPPHQRPVLLEELAVFLVCR